MSQVVKDLSPHILPPNVWTNVRNMRFREGKLEKVLGHQAVTTPSVDPYWLLPVSTASTFYWLYAGAAKVYEWHVTTHTDITRASGGDYTGTYNGWTGGIFNGIPVINSGADVPQVWNPIGPATDLAALANWPSGWLCKALRPFKQFLIAMNITKTGVEYPQLVAWSHPADPGSVPASWDSSDDTKDAGENPLSETPGLVVDGMTLRDTFMVYKEDAAYTCNFVGGGKVLDFRQLSNTAGILSRNCIAPYVHKGPKQAVFGVDDCFVTDGTSIDYIFDKLWRRWIYSRIDSTYFNRCFVAVNGGSREVWFCIVETGQTLPSVAVIWNWVTGQVGARDLPNVSHIQAGGFSTVDDSWNSDTDAWNSDASVWTERAYNPTQTKVFMAVPGASKKILEGEVTTQFEGTNFESYVEREGLTVIKQDTQGNLVSDTELRKLVAEVWPNVEADPGTEVLVQVGVQERLNDAITWSDEMPYVVGTDVKLTPLIAGRFVAIRFRTIGTNMWKIINFDLDIRPLGKY